MQFGKITAPDTFRLERKLKAPAARVWAYVTEGEKRARWFTGGDNLTEAGQAFTFLFAHFNITNESPAALGADGKRAIPDDGQGARLQAPRLLEITWGDGDEAVSHVRFELIAQGEETLLVLTHTRSTPENAANFAGGWTAHVQTLADLLEGGPSNRFWAYVVEAHDHYEGAA